MSPKVSRFYGIDVYINFYDHPPPHLHATHGEHIALVRIRPDGDDGTGQEGDENHGQITQGALPKASRRLLRKWMRLYRQDLFYAWESAQKGIQVKLPPY